MFMEKWYATFCPEGLLEHSCDTPLTALRKGVGLTCASQYPTGLAYRKLWAVTPLAVSATGYNRRWKCPHHGDKLSQLRILLQSIVTQFQPCVAIQFR